MKTKNKMLSTVFAPCLQFVCLISLFVTGISIVASRFFVVTHADLGKMIFWNVEYFFVLALYLELGNVSKLLKEKNLVLITGLYGISFVMAWFSCDYYLLNFWMLGVLLLGIVIPAYVAIAFQAILTISYCMVNNLSVEEFICYFTIGTLLLLLAQFLDKFWNMIIIMVIAVTTNFAFLILLADFNLTICEKTIYELISTVVMVFVLWLVKRLHGAHYKKSLTLKEEPMKKLKELAPNLYQHGLEIGTLSAEAAKVIGAKEEIAFAGGCYHEIGRIEKHDGKQEGRQYIDDGVKMLKKYGVAEDIIDVVKQHNIHYEIPESKEAAVVMLSDSILSSIKYLFARKSSEEIHIEEVVESIMNRRFEKGILNDSKLSIEEIIKLKEFYVKKMQECEKSRSQ